MLKEVRKVKVKRVEGSEKWVTRPRRGRGRSKKTLVKKNKIEDDWWEGNKNEKRFKKT